MTDHACLSVASDCHEAAILWGRIRRVQEDHRTLVDALKENGVRPEDVHHRIMQALFNPVARVWYRIRNLFGAQGDWDAEWLLTECLGQCRFERQVRQCFEEYQANPGRSHSCLEHLLFQPTLEQIWEAYYRLRTE